jgi:hypothetical protein
VIALLLAAAIALLVLSLPLAQTSFGGTLRKAAAVCFLLALLPSVLVPIFFAPRSTPSSVSDTSNLLEHVRDTLAFLAGAALVSLGAYGILVVRKRFVAPKKEPWEALFGRSAGKKRVGNTGHPPWIDREDGL